ncbi:MAG: hypothetical protein J7J99_00615 [Thermoprotei archaeon]|nr:hypothetical protein [Thermoprotei archaeon]
MMVSNSIERKVKDLEKRLNDLEAKIKIVIEKLNELIDTFNDHVHYVESTGNDCEPPYNKVKELR